MNKPAVFLDKDGTLLEDVPYNVEPRLMRLAAGAQDALRLLAPHFQLIVVSNQSGVAHGYFAESALASVERQLRKLVGGCGAELAGFYYCPHHPRGSVAVYRMDCECRKPRPGMLKQAAEQLGINLSHSWMVGDILDDIEAGYHAGCRTVLVDNGGETEWQLSASRQPDYTAGDLFSAAEFILQAAAEEAPEVAGAEPRLAGTLANSRHRGDAPVDNTLVEHAPLDHVVEAESPGHRRDKASRQNDLCGAALPQPPLVYKSQGSGGKR